MQSLRIVTVVGNADVETRIAKEISTLPGAELVLRCLERTELLATIRGARIDLVVIVGNPSWLDPYVLSTMVDHDSRAVGVAADPLEAEGLRRLGIEVASPGASARDLLAEAPQIASEPSSPEPPRSGSRGRLVAVWGPKGAPGRSTVAVELAAEIAAQEPDTALIDGDTYGGDLAQMLAVVEELPTIVWAAQSASDGTLGQGSITSMLRRSSPNGPVLLPGINRSELWSDITLFGWERLLDVFTASFRYTLVDVGFGLENDDRLQRGRDRLARQTIQEADVVVAVCRADPIGLKTFLWSAERLKEIRPLDDVLVVANQVAGGDADEVRYILKKHLGKRPLVCVPSRDQDVRTALDRGVPVRDIKPGGEVSARIRELAGALGASVPARGVLTRLGGRR